MHLLQMLRADSLLKIVDAKTEVITKKKIGYKLKAKKLKATKQEPKAAAQRLRSEIDARINKTVFK